MNWKQLTDFQQLKQLTEASYQDPVLFFKHSTRCSLSVMALNRFERDWNNMTVDFFSKCNMWSDSEDTGLLHVRLKSRIEFIERQ